MVPWVKKGNQEACNQATVSMSKQSYLHDFHLEQGDSNARNPHFTQHRRHRLSEPGCFIAGRVGKGLERELWLPVLWTLFAGTSKT